MLFILLKCQGTKTTFMNKKYNLHYPLIMRPITKTYANAQNECQLKGIIVQLVKYEVPSYDAGP